MPTKRLEASVRRDGAIAIIDLQGEIDSFGEGPLSSAYAEATQNSATRVLLNFTGVTYMNSTGIALIVTLISKARRTGVRLGIYGLTPHYTEIFHVTRLSDYVDLYADAISALSAAPVSA